MRIAITGATGFIGSALSKGLCELGLDVVEYVRTPMNPKQVKIDLSWNILPKNYLKDIDILIHCAASVHKRDNPETIYHQNAIFTQLLIDSAVESGLKGVYFISTVGVFGKLYSDVLITEKSELAPKNDYSKSKLAAEYIVKYKCLFNKIPFNIIRLPLVLGPNSPGSFGVLLKLIKKGIPLPFKGIKNKRSILFLDDFVMCIGYMLRNDIYINESGIMCQSKPLSTSDIILHGNEFLLKEVLLFEFPNVILHLFRGNKFYNQLYLSLEFSPHPVFKNILDSR